MTISESLLESLIKLVKSRPRKPYNHDKVNSVPLNPGDIVEGLNRRSKQLRRPITAYNIFLKTHLRKSRKDLSKVVMAAKKWSALKDDDKTKYSIMAEKYNELYLHGKSATEQKNDTSTVMSDNLKEVRKKKIIDYHINNMKEKCNKTVENTDIFVEVPKRSYQDFVSYFLPILRKKYPHLNQMDFYNICSESWQSIDPRKRSHYVASLNQSKKENKPGFRAYSQIAYVSLSEKFPSLPHENLIRHIEFCWAYLSKKERDIFRILESGSTKISTSSTAFYHYVFSQYKCFAMQESLKNHVSIMKYLTANWNQRIPESVKHMFYMDALVSRTLDLSKLQPIFSFRKTGTITEPFYFIAKYEAEDTASCSQLASYSKLNHINKIISNNSQPNETILRDIDQKIFLEFQKADRYFTAELCSSTSEKVPPGSFSYYLSFFSKNCSREQRKNLFKSASDSWRSMSAQEKAKFAKISKLQRADYRQKRGTIASSAPIMDSDSSKSVNYIQSLQNLLEEASNHTLKPLENQDALLLKDSTYTAIFSSAYRYYCHKELSEYDVQEEQVGFMDLLQKVTSRWKQPVKLQQRAHG